MEGDEPTATDKKTEETPLYSCRIWSLTSRDFLVLTKNGDTIQPGWTGSGDGPTSEVNVYENTENPTMGENSAHFVFSSSDDQKYALNADEQNGAISFTHYTRPTATTGAFVRESLGTELGPFFALRVAKSKKCIAADKDGNLSLKPFNRVFPHPHTFFIVSQNSENSD